MFSYDDVKIRKFEEKDIPLKVKWINDPNINTYLHYDLPLTIEGTTKWFDRIKDRNDRFDGTVEYNGVPVGICGLLNIDHRNKRAEIYFTIGDQSFQHRGICTKGFHILFDYAFNDLGLNKITGLVEAINVPSLGLVKKFNFKHEGTLVEDVKQGDVFIDRHCFAYFAKDYFKDYESSKK